MRSVTPPYSTDGTERGKTTGFVLNLRLAEKNNRGKLRPWTTHDLDGVIESVLSSFLQQGMGRWVHAKSFV